MGRVVAEDAVVMVLYYLDLYILDTDCWFLVNKYYE